MKCWIKTRLRQSSYCSLTKDDRVWNYGGFWRRAGAFALDYVLMAIYLLAVTLLFLFLNTLFDVNQWLFSDRIRGQLTASLLVTLPVLLYFALAESSAWQGTWGKRRLGLKVADIDGDRISFGRALARNLLKFIPWELSHTLIWEIRFTSQTDSMLISYGFALVYLLIGVNILALVMNKKRQTLYDLLVKTYVINQR
ncbi:MAG: RDD family protein [Chloroflexi bacterium]|nr:MAG: RDD family protein [Chloroflexota bacterium]